MAFITVPTYTTVSVRKQKYTTEGLTYALNNLMEILISEPYFKLSSLLRSLSSFLHAVLSIF